MAAESPSPGRTDPWSISESALYRELRSRLARNDPGVLATIVDVEGSAYRRPGAKMMITPEGGSLGAVTAGCLEGPVVDIAASVLDDGTPRVETFDLMDNDEWGLGLGCNGIIDILLEPLDASFAPALTMIDDRRPVTLFTVIDSTDSTVAIGDRTLLDGDGNRLPVEDRNTIIGDAFSFESWAASLRDSGGSNTTTVSTDNGEVTVFADHVEPNPRLLLFGSQNDINPVARIGRDVGFEVVVASARGAQSSNSEFPHAHDVVATHPTNIAEYVDSETYAVLMSHNFLDDRLALETLLSETDVPYVGLMGPRERFHEMQETFAEEGTRFTTEQLDRVATPVGLDLGGGEPVQIALSVVSEVLAVANGRTGGRLREQEGPVHDRVPSP